MCNKIILSHITCRCQQKNTKLLKNVIRYDILGGVGFVLKDNIKRLRKEKNLTQIELAEYLEVSASSIGMYEQGRREPDFKILKKMSLFFNVSVDNLIDCTKISTFKKEDRDVSDLIFDMNEYLQRQKGLMFNGQMLTDNDITMIMEALKEGLNIAIDKNKDK